MSGRSGGVLLPATFEERGAIVAFTTPTLSLARVRRDARQRLILLMPNFGGTEGAFIVPWNAVGEVTAMSLHDRALHEEIESTDSAAPDKLRTCVLRVGQSGLAGPLVAEASRLALDGDRRKQIELHFLLIVALLNSLGLETDELLTLKSSQEAWRLKVKALLTQAGRRIGIEVNDIQTRIGALARVLLPLGLSSGRQDGRLRSLLHGFADFRDTITEWSESEKSDLAPFARFAGLVADDTLNSADELFGQLDTALRDMVSVVRDWNVQAKIVVGLAGKLCWLLDGWDLIFVFWDQVQSDPIEIQRETVGRIIRVLPLIPRNEVIQSSDALEQQQLLIQGRQIQSNQDWRRARSDFDLVTRIEAAKARVLGS
ncbi:MAG: hypothetical protein WCC64_17140 [Aliidongia sp.]